MAGSLNPSFHHPPPQHSPPTMWAPGELPNFHLSLASSSLISCGDKQYLTNVQSCSVMSQSFTPFKREFMGHYCHLQNQHPIWCRIELGCSTVHLANVPQRAAADGPSALVPALMWKTRKNGRIPGLLDSTWPSLSCYAHCRSRPALRRILSLSLLLPLPLCNSAFKGNKDFLKVTEYMSLYHLLGTHLCILHIWLASTSWLLWTIKCEHALQTPFQVLIPLLCCVYLEGKFLISRNSA